MSDQTLQDYNDHDEIVDAIGLRCPEPLMLVRNKIRDMAPGKVVLVKATDPTTERDLKQFCHFIGHEIMAINTQAEVHKYWIKKTMQTS